MDPGLSSSPRRAVRCPQRAFSRGVEVVVSAVGSEKSQRELVGDELGWKEEKEMREERRTEDGGEEEQMVGSTAGDCARAVDVSCVVVDVQGHVRAEAGPSDACDAEWCACAKVECFAHPSRGMGAWPVAVNNREADSGCERGRRRARASELSFGTGHHCRLDLLVRSSRKRASPLASPA